MGPKDRWARARSGSRAARRRRTTRSLASGGASPRREAPASSRFAFGLLLLFALLVGLPVLLSAGLAPCGRGGQVRQPEAPAEESPTLVAPALQDLDQARLLQLPNVALDGLGGAIQD